jgi:hypothetical protein
MGGVNSYLSREKKKRCMAIRVGTIRFQSTGIFLLLLTLIAAAAAAAAASAGDEMCVDLTIDRKYPPLELSGRRRRRCRRVLAPVPRRFKKGNFPSEKPKKQNKTKLFREKICVHTQVLKTLHSRKVALAASSKDCTHAIYT